MPREYKFTAGNGSIGSAVLTEEKLEFESVPEYVRESRSSLRDSYALPSYSNSKSSAPEVESDQAISAKSAEIETLWPGVGAEFLHGGQAKKQPSFYFGFGFIAGLLTASAVVGIVIGAIYLARHATSSNTVAKIVVTQGTSSLSTQSTQLTKQAGQDVAIVTTRTVQNGDPEVVTPAFPTYTVKEGDTLAGIAWQAYKRATPRLLDEICKANNMRNADVLNLGQSIILPEYRPQTRQVTNSM